MRGVLVAVLVVALLASSPAFAEQARGRTYVLPDHGVFQVSVPISWKDEIRQPPRRLPPTIAFTPAAGRPSFQVILMTLWPARPDIPYPSSFEIRQEVERFAARAQSQAVEATLEVKELRGTTGVGYYFAATDKAPAPDEYKFITQGMLRVGGLLVTFTILTNDGQVDVLNDAMAMITGAQHISN
jgi:hypothetical protein